MSDDLSYLAERYESILTERHKQHVLKENQSDEGTFGDLQRSWHEGDDVPPHRKKTIPRPPTDADKIKWSKQLKEHERPGAPIPSPGPGRLIYWVPKAEAEQKIDALNDTIHGCIDNLKDYRETIKSLRKQLASGLKTNYEPQRGGYEVD